MPLTRIELVLPASEARVLSVKLQRPIDTALGELLGAPDWI